MKLSDCFKYSFTKVIRDKKNIYFMIILIICCLLMMGAISFSKAFFITLKSSESTSSSRSLIIRPNANTPQEAKEFMKENLDKVAELEHILEISNKTGFVVADVEQFKSPIHDGSVELIRGNEYSLPENIIGEKFTSEDTGVAICPIHFYPGSMEEYPKGKKDIFINGYDLLNNTFEASINMYDVVNNEVVTTGKYKKTFKVVGLYDPNETGDFAFNCYTSGKDIEEMFNASMSNLSNEEGEEVTIPSAQVLVDKYENMEEVKKKIVDMGFRITPVVEPNIAYQNSIKYTCIFIVFIAILSIVLLTISYVKKKNLNNSYELGILKALGYTNSEIINVNTIQIFIISIFSYLMSIIIFLIALAIIKYSLKNYLIFTGYGFYLNQYVSTYFISLIVIIIFPVISAIISTSKTIKATVNYIIKGDNI